jgi:hypothetical protein
VGARTEGSSCSCCGVRSRGTLLEDLVDMDRDIRTAVDEMVLRDLGSDIVERERVGEEVTSQVWHG